MARLAIEPIKALVRRTFPTARFEGQIKAALAYGSVAIKQQNESPVSSQLDLILMVEDKDEFHRCNLETNREHYGRLVKRAGSHIIRRADPWLPVAKTFYNTHVPIDQVEHRALGDSFEYGVISEVDAIKDCLNWNLFYVAGRLQKPVSWLWSNSPIEQAVLKNQQAAAATVLIDPSPPGDLHDFYHRLVSLSYEGDWRMRFGEDKQKAQKLVAGPERQQLFDALYQPILTSGSFAHVVSVNGDRSISYPLEAMEERMQYLRDSVPEQLAELLNPEDPVNSYRKFKRAIRDRVYQSSLQQAILALVFTDLYKTYFYSLAKLRKMYQSTK